MRARCGKVITHYRAETRCAIATEKGRQDRPGDEDKTMAVITPVANFRWLRRGGRAAGEVGVWSDKAVWVFSWSVVLPRECHRPPKPRRLAVVKGGRGRRTSRPRAVGTTNRGDFQALRPQTMTCAMPENTTRRKKKKHCSPSRVLIRNPDLSRSARAGRPVPSRLEDCGPPVPRENGGEKVPTSCPTFGITLVHEDGYRIWSSIHVPSSVVCVCVCVRVRAIPLRGFCVARLPSPRKSPVGKRGR